MEEEARRRAEKAEAARKAQEAQKKREEEEKRLAREPQTREDLDIELVTEEMLDDNLSVQGTKEQRRKKHREDNTSSHIEEQVEDEELDVETNGTVAEAGPQLDKKEVEEDLENQTLGRSDSKPGLLSGLTSNALTITSPDQASDEQAPTTTSTSSNAEQNTVQISAINRSQSSRSQEKREQRRRRGLEHNQRETERAASSSSSGPSKDQASPPKSKSQEPSKLKERSDSKELDQYTFVEWKMKEDKGGKKEEKPSSSPPPPAGPVRPSTLALQEPVPERNGLGEGEGVVNLHRRLGAMKDKPEKWRARMSDGERFDSASSPPPHDSKRPQLYVFYSDQILKSTLC